MAGRETPATRAARAVGIAFQVLEYDPDEASESYGLEIELAPGDHLVTITGATTAALARR